MDLTMIVITLLKAGIVFFVLMNSVPIMTVVERRGSAFIQLRLGPNRVGPFGLFQPLADGVKSMWKEQVVPPEAHRPTFVMAPLVACCAAYTAFAVIPFGGVWELSDWKIPFTDIVLHLSGYKVPLVVADFDPGILVLLAASSMGVYGIMMAGWASNSKYSQLGGLRSSSQMISYELALGLGVIGVAVFNGTLRLYDIVEFQSNHLWNIVYMPVGALVLFVAGYAETNRAPFDLPEAESELVAGYHTEYNSLGFALFAMAEYVNMFTASALFVTLFLGGYHVPFGGFGLSGGWLHLAEAATFLLKTGFFLWLFVWVRWTLPRFRFDQLMRIGWKILIPLALANVVWAGLLVSLGVGK